MASPFFKLGSKIKLTKSGVTRSRTISFPGISRRIKKLHVKGTLLTRGLRINMKSITKNARGMDEGDVIGKPINQKRRGNVSAKAMMAGKRRAYTALGAVYGGAVYANYRSQHHRRKK